ncbi:ABC-2 type transporter [Cystobacter fuscus DSM 2262]|uniref:Transport permease protein n=1 Tax=Cystobacter fuscus (strain ATCC 25194 / DSM 2262 / NBRC 100088 / M29) TaxID=1242864 RepID=S9P692_CYSF2|nr:ABC transporter permease [Cystobacter fuscus]EPX58681.1 ABC-2 type transporter [Cystobacter fuscus DSM 2262]
MNPSRVTAIVLRQFYLLRGSPARILPLFIWVAIDVVLWGFITRYLNTVTASGLDFVASLLGTVLLWNFLTRAMQGVTMAFFEDVWSRNFLNLFATPLSTSEYISGLVLSSIATSSIGLVVMVAVAGAAFGLSLFTYGVLLLPFLLVLFLYGIALGVFGSAVVLRLGPAAEWLIWPIPAMVSPFACVFYPRATLPEWMQFLSLLFPPSYVFEGMRAIATGGPFSGTALLVGVGLALLCLLLACVFFLLIYQEALRSGRIARYSAESVS